MHDPDSDAFDRAIRKTLEHRPPAFSDAQAAQLVASVFGIQGAAQTITGERDQNFRVSAEDGGVFVLKIANAAETLAVLDFQNHELEAVRLLQPRIPASRLVAARDGSLLTRFVAQGETYGVRLLTYLEGTPQSRCGPQGVEVRRAIGRVSAGIGLALATVDHPSADYPLLWDMKHAARLRRFAGAIVSAEERAVVSDVLRRFEEAVQPAFASLVWQPIHNDLNRNNILLEQAGSPVLSGIIDFGDSVYAPRVIDVAVTVAHQIYDEADPIAAACDVLSAYVELAPLSAAETALLVDLIATRLMMRLAIKAWRYTTFPDRPEYYLPGLDEAYLATVDRLRQGRSRADSMFRDIVLQTA